MADDFDFGEALKEGLAEAAAWKRGELILESVVDPMPVERIRAIRRKVAKSAKDFERRFGNWEQGRRAPDPSSRLLLKLIERAPDLVEETAAT